MNTKILTIITAIIGILGIVFLIMVGMADGDENVDSASGTMVSYAFYLLIATAVIAVIISIIELIANPAALKKALVNIVILAVLFAIAYFVSSDSIPLNASGQPMQIKSGDRILPIEEAKNTAKWVGTLITYTGILGVLGILAIVFGFVKSLTNK